MNRQLHVLFVFVVSLILFSFSESSENLAVLSGTLNYSTYYVGNAPVIILSQHGGSLKPSNIPDRVDGCWNGTDCLWWTTCDTDTTFSRDSTKCGVSISADSYTKELAQCLHEQLTFNVSINGTNDTNGIHKTLYPHMVVSELHRSKLDPNRDYGEATLNNSIAATTYNEIHYQFMKWAKGNVTNQCNWGVVIDVHGQARNDFEHLGYRVSQSELLYDASELQGEIDSVSISSLATKQFNYYGTTLDQLIRGPNSLGNYMNQTYGSQKVIPSYLKPDFGTYDGTSATYYFSGGFASYLHGSGSTTDGVIDAFQYESSSANRFDETKREQVCYELSQSVRQYIYHWYNLSSCDGFTFLTDVESQTKAPTVEPTTPAPTSITDVIFYGDNNYTNYYVGNSPIIILASHGGSLEPDSIPDREEGCYTSSDPECLWYHDCEISTSYSQDDSNCGISTTKWSNSLELAQCLRETMVINNSDTDYEALLPHLVVNQLHRRKLDTDQTYGEATLMNADAGVAYNETHYKWMEMAKNASKDLCDWGIIFDIHGQSDNSIELGYYVTSTQLGYSDNRLNEEIDSTSIRSLAEYNYDNFQVNFSTILRGNSSLGSYLNRTGYPIVIPSETVPTADGFSITQGGEATKIHGSQYGGVIDAIYVAVPYSIRGSSSAREQFCQDFSESAIKFIYKWYDTSNCKWGTQATTTSEPTNIPSSSPSAVPTTAPSGQPTDLPSSEPTQSPTAPPSAIPTPSPTPDPTDSPSSEPSESPTAPPTPDPTKSPSPEPTPSPTTAKPTNSPSQPTITPTDYPTTSTRTYTLTINTADYPDCETSDSPKFYFMNEDGDRTYYQTLSTTGTQGTNTTYSFTNSNIGKIASFYMTMTSANTDSFCFDLFSFSLLQQEDNDPIERMCSMDYQGYQYMDYTCDGDQGGRKKIFLNVTELSPICWNIYENTTNKIENGYISQQGYQDTLITTDNADVYNDENSTYAVTFFTDDAASGCGSSSSRFSVSFHSNCTWYDESAGGKRPYCNSDYVLSTKYESFTASDLYGNRTVTFNGPSIGNITHMTINTSSTDGWCLGAFNVLLNDGDKIKKWSYCDLTFSSYGILFDGDCSFSYGGYISYTLRVDEYAPYCSVDYVSVTYVVSTDVEVTLTDSNTRRRSGRRLLFFEDTNVTAVAITFLQVMEWFIEYTLYVQTDASNDDNNVTFSVDYSVEIINSNLIINLLMDITTDSANISSILETYLVNSDNFVNNVTNEIDAIVNDEPGFIDSASCDICEAPSMLLNNSNNQLFSGGQGGGSIGLSTVSGSGSVEVVQFHVNENNPPPGAGGESDPNEPSDYGNLTNSNNSISIISTTDNNGDDSNNNEDDSSSPLVSILIVVGTIVAVTVIGLWCVYKPKNDKMQQKSNKNVEHDKPQAIATQSIGSTTNTTVNTPRTETPTDTPPISPVGDSSPIDTGNFRPTHNNTGENNSTAIEMVY